MRTPIAVLLITVLALPACTQRPASPLAQQLAQQSVSGQVNVGLLKLDLPPGAWLPAGTGERIIAGGKFGDHMDFAEKTFLQTENGRVSAMLTLYAAKWPDWAGRWDDPANINCALEETGTYYASRVRMTPGRAPKQDCLFVRVSLASPDFVGLNDTVKREAYAAAMEHGGVPKVFVTAAYAVGTPAAVALVELQLNPQLAGLSDWGPADRLSGAIHLDHLDAAHKAYLDKVVRRAEAWRPEVASGLR